MNKKHLILLISSTVSAVVLGVLVGVGTGVIKNIKANEQQTEYKLSLNVASKLSLDEGGNWDNPKSSNSKFVRKTGLGNDIDFRFSGGRALTSVDNNFCIARNSDAWIANETPINGIYKIAIKCQAVQTFRFDIGDSKVLNDYSYSSAKPSYVVERTEEFTGSSTYTIEFDNTECKYFRFQQASTGNNWIEYIDIYYNCQHKHEYVFHEGYDNAREKDGIDDYYTCTLCDGVFDKNKKQTTLDGLKIKSRLHSFEAESKGVWIPFVSSLESIVNVDIKMNNESEAVWLCFYDRQNDWDRTEIVKFFGDGTFSNSGHIEGISYVGKTHDGYQRFKFDIANMWKEQGKFKVVTDLYIYQWSRGAGVLDINPTVGRIGTAQTLETATNKTYDFPQKLNISTDIVYYDILFSSGNDTKFALMIGNWTSHCGYYNLYPTGTKENYPGVSFKKLLDGFIRFKFVISQLKDVSSKGDMKLLYIRGDWSTASGLGELIIDYAQNPTVEDIY